MSRSRIKAVLCAGSLLAGGIIAWCIAAHRTVSASSVAFVDRAREVRVLLESRATQKHEVRAAECEATELASIPTRPSMSAGDAALLFPIDGVHHVYDEHAYFRYRGGLAEQCEWYGYPGGRFARRTSREGFREDFDRLPEKRDALVVVAGDSQTEGLCSNSESYPNLAEAELCAMHPGRAIQVVNAGVAGYSYNYLGTLENVLASRPDVFVMTFYSGNDFKDIVVPCHYFQRSGIPASRPEHARLLKEAISTAGSAAVIALHPIAYFKNEPEERALAESAALAACVEVQRICIEHGIDLLVVHIPPAFRPGARASRECAAAQEALALSDEDMEIDDRMATELIDALRDRRVEVLDLRDRWPEDLETYYASDMHLNLAGQAFVAKCLAPRLDALLACRSSAADSAQRH
jgi:hypothetical protein